MTWSLDKDIHSALDVLQFHYIQSSPIQRAEKSYRNFLAILEIGREEQRRFSQSSDSLWAYAESEEQPGDSVHKELLQSLYWQHSVQRERMEALIRAIYEAASVTIGIICAEALRNSGEFQVSLKKLAKNKKSDLLCDVDIHALTDAWAVTEYRNKLIAHHDEPRSFAFRFDRDGYKLSPMGPAVFPSLSEGDLKTTERLWSDYGPRTSSPDNVNIHLRRNRLFRAVPVIKEANLNPDRTDIDKLVEKYGTDSMTLRELADSVRTFILALADVV